MEHLHAGNLVATVCKHLVHVHVALGARACLPDLEREHVVVLAGQDFICCLADERGLLFCEAAELGICLGCRLLEEGEGMDDALGHRLRPDPEVLVGALGLRSPEGPGRNLDLSHGIVLDARGAVHSCLLM